MSSDAKLSVSEETTVEKLTNKFHYEWFGDKHCDFRVLSISPEVCMHFIHTISMVIAPRGLNFRIVSYVDEEWKYHADYLDMHCTVEYNSKLRTLGVIFIYPGKNWTEPVYKEYTLPRDASICALCSFPIRKIK
jgi:hypothetical protein